MNYKILFDDLRNKMLDKKLELLAIDDFLAQEEIHPIDRLDIEVHKFKVWRELKELELKYDWHYKLAVESGNW